MIIVKFVHAPSLLGANQEHSHLACGQVVEGMFKPGDLRPQPGSSTYRRDSMPAVGPLCHSLAGGVLRQCVIIAELWVVDEVGLPNFSQEDWIAWGDADPFLLIHRPEMRVGYKSKITMFEPSIHSPI